MNPRAVKQRALALASKDWAKRCHASKGNPPDRDALCWVNRELLLMAAGKDAARLLERLWGVLSHEARCAIPAELWSDIDTHLDGGER